jgi:hypothetical protein
LALAHDKKNLGDRYVQDTSPVRDILANPVPVKTSIEAL